MRAKGGWSVVLPRERGGCGVSPPRRVNSGRGGGEAGEWDQERPMGSMDITLHTEVKIHGQWHHYGSPNVWRNPYLFEWLCKDCGPEGITPLLNEPRGLPEDVTAVTKMDADDHGPDGYSHSYITAPEIAALAS